MDLLFSTAYAQTAGASGGDTLMAFLPLVLVLVVFYFLVLRPQSLKTKEHANLITTLRRGDKVLTTGGFTVVIDKVDGENLEVSFAEGKAVLLKSSVVSVLEQASEAKTAKPKAKAGKKPAPKKSKK